MANHNGTAFPIPKRLGLWDDKIAKNATVVEMKNAKAIHKACSKDYKIWQTAEDSCKKSSSALQWKRCTSTNSRMAPCSFTRSLHLTSLNI
jgi:hypothetical protein